MPLKDLLLVVFPKVLQDMLLVMYLLSDKNSKDKHPLNHLLMDAFPRQKPHSSLIINVSQITLSFKQIHEPGEDNKMLKKEP